jgi:KTSC domain
VAEAVRVGGGLAKLEVPKLNLMDMPSSVIKAMRYEPKRRVLKIAFRGPRGMYRYFDVPAEEWVEFCSASSKGTYLNEIFKGKGHRYERVVSRALDRYAPGEGEVCYWGEPGVFDERALEGARDSGE